MRRFEIPLPRLLDASGNTVRRIRPISCSVNLNITPLSYASMELPIGESLPERAYVEMFTSLGSAGIFRVRSPQDAYGMDSTTAELEHAIVEVGDYLVLEKYDAMMPASTAMQTIFSHYRGTRWQLGDVSVLGNTQIAVEADHVRVLEAMLALLDQKPECMLSFNFGTTPWTVSVSARPTVVSAEARLSRNVNSAKIIYDDTELCTRVYYPIPTTEDASAEKTANVVSAFDVQKNYSSGSYVSKDTKVYRLTDEHTSGTTWEDTSKTKVTDSPSSDWAYMDADTVSTYGIVERSISVGNDYTAEEAQFAATEYLKKHKRPRITVDISAEDLSDATGEPFDMFFIGVLCRLALVDYGVTVARTITALSWPDVYGRPYDFNVTLADEEDTAVTFLHDMDAKGGGGGGGGSKAKEEAKWKEYWTKSVQDDYHFELMAVRVNEMNNILQQAGIYIDSDGVIQYARDNENMWASHLQVQADRISLVVEGTGEHAKIKPAAIIASINEEGSTIRISADKVDLDAYVTASAIKAKYAQITDLQAVTVEIERMKANLTVSNNITCSGLSVGSTFSFAGASGSWVSKQVVTGVTFTKPSLTLGPQASYLYGSTSTGPTGSHNGKLVTGWSDGGISVEKEMLNFLGGTGGGN